MNNLTIKRSKLIEYLIYVHILLITVQLALRELFIDTTFFRDIVLIIIFLFWFFSKKNSKTFFNQKKNAFEYWIRSLIIYGIIVSFIQFYSGVNFLNVLLQFRNIFLPLLLYFVGKTIYKSPKERANLTNFLYLLFFLILIDVWLESLAFSFGFSKYSFPWYSYQFKHSYRYTTSSDFVPDSVTPENSPIIGILGLPLATSATFFALFSFLIAFFIGKKDNIVNGFIYNIKPLNIAMWKVYIIFIFTIGVLIILGVKMQLVSIFFLIMILFSINPRKYFMKLVLATFFLGIVLFLTSDLWWNIISLKYETAFVGGAKNISTFSRILNWEIISNILSSWTDISPVFVFFGGFDYTHFRSYPYLELRLINFTLQLGLFWFILFIGLITSVLISCIKLYRSNKLNNFDKQFVLGSLLLTFAYFLDMLHYARLMYWPNIDIFAVVLGALSNIRIQKKESKVDNV